LPNFYFDKEVLEYLGQTEQDKTNKITEQDKPNKKEDKIKLILEFCKTPKSVKEIMEYIGLKHRPTFIYNIRTTKNLNDNTRKTKKQKSKIYNDFVIGFTS